MSRKLGEVSKGDVSPNSKRSDMSSRFSIVVRKSTVKIQLQYRKYVM
ncbi:MAG: hypothetical protein LBI20_00300 [Holosporales bacterium]|nr:hypothetical protein [Holosporales bacterium]